MYVERVGTRDDKNRFEIRITGGDYAGDPLFIAEREHLKDGTRGYWLLMMKTLLGWLQVDRDQYQNDLIERAEIYHQTGKIYGDRFKIECTKASYLLNWPDWVAELAFQFGGEWVADYHDWEDRAVLTKKVA